MPRKWTSGLSDLSMAGGGRRRGRGKLSKAALYRPGASADDVMGLVPGSGAAGLLLGGSVGAGIGLGLGPVGDPFGALPANVQGGGVLGGVSLAELARPLPLTGTGGAVRPAPGPATLADDTSEAAYDAHTGRPQPEVPVGARNKRHGGSVSFDDSFSSLFSADDALAQAGAPALGPPRGPGAQNLPPAHAAPTAHGAANAAPAMLGDTTGSRVLQSQLGGSEAAAAAGPGVTTADKENAAGDGRQGDSDSRRRHRSSRRDTLSRGGSRRGARSNSSSRHKHKRHGNRGGDSGHGASSSGGVGVAAPKYKIRKGRASRGAAAFGNKRAQRGGGGAALRGPERGDDDDDRDDYSDDDMGDAGGGDRRRSSGAGDGRRGIDPSGTIVAADEALAEIDASGRPGSRAHAKKVEARRYIEHLDREIAQLEDSDEGATGSDENDEAGDKRRRRRDDDAEGDADPMAMYREAVAGAGLPHVRGASAGGANGDRDRSSRVSESKASPGAASAGSGSAGSATGTTTLPSMNAKASGSPSAPAAGAAADLGGASANQRESEPTQTVPASAGTGEGKRRTVAATARSEWSPEPGSPVGTPASATASHGATGTPPKSELAALRPGGNLQDILFGGVEPVGSLSLTDGDADEDGDDEFSAAMQSYYESQAALAMSPAADADLDLDADFDAVTAAAPDTTSLATGAHSATAPRAIPGSESKGATVTTTGSPTNPAVPVEQFTEGKAAATRGRGDLAALIREGDSLLGRTPAGAAAPTSSMAQQAGGRQPGPGAGAVPKTVTRPGTGAGLRRRGRKKRVSKQGGGGAAAGGGAQAGDKQARGVKIQRRVDKGRGRGFGTGAAAQTAEVSSGGDGGAGGAAAFGGASGPGVGRRRRLRKRRRKRDSGEDTPKWQPDELARMLSAGGAAPGAGDADLALFLSQAMNDLEKDMQQRVKAAEAERAAKAAADAAASKTARDDDDYDESGSDNSDSDSGGEEEVKQQTTWSSQSLAQMLAGAGEGQGGLDPEAMEAMIAAMNTMEHMAAQPLSRNKFLPTTVSRARKPVDIMPQLQEAAVEGDGDDDVGDDGAVHGGPAAGAGGDMPALHVLYTTLELAQRKREADAAAAAAAAEAVAASQAPAAAEGEDSGGDVLTHGDRGEEVKAGASRVRTRLSRTIEDDMRLNRTPRDADLGRDGAMHTPGSDEALARQGSLSALKPIATPMARTQSAPEIEFAAARPLLAAGPRKLKSLPAVQPVVRPKNRPSGGGGSPGMAVVNGTTFDADGAAADESPSSFVDEDVSDVDSYPAASPAKSDVSDAMYTPPRAMSRTAASADEAVSSPQAAADARFEAAMADTIAVRAQAARSLALANSVAAAPPPASPSASPPQVQFAVDQTYERGVTREVRRPLRK